MCAKKTKQCFEFLTRTGQRKKLIRSFLIQLICTLNLKQKKRWNSWKTKCVYTGTYKCLTSAPSPSLSIKPLMTERMLNCIMNNWWLCVTVLQNSHELLHWIRGGDGGEHRLCVLHVQLLSGAMCDCVSIEHRWSPPGVSDKATQSILYERSSAPSLTPPSLHMIPEPTGARGSLTGPHCVVNLLGSAPNHWEEINLIWFWPAEGAPSTNNPSFGTKILEYYQSNRHIKYYWLPVYQNIHLSESSLWTFPETMFLTKQLFLIMLLLMKTNICITMLHHILGKTRILSTNRLHKILF